MPSRPAVEVPPDQIPVRQRVDGKRQRVAGHADATDHLLVRAQVGVLIVLDDDPVLAGDPAPLARQVAGGATDAAPRLARARGLPPPEPMVGRIDVGQRVFVRVAGETSLDRGGADIDAVNVVAGAAVIPLSGSSDIV